LVRRMELGKTKMDFPTLFPLPIEEEVHEPLWLDGDEDYVDALES